MSVTTYRATAKIPVLTYVATPAVAAWTIASTGGLLYGYDNGGLATGALTSIADRSSAARTLTTSGTASARPVGLPRNWAQNGRGVYAFVAANSTWAQDQGASAAAYAAPLIRPGTSLMARVQLQGSNANDQHLVSTWAGATTGTDGFVLSFEGASNPATSVLRVRKCDSVIGGDLLQSLAVTPAGAIKPHDTLTVVFRHLADRSWTLTVYREARHPGEATPAPIVVSGTSFNAPLAPLASYGLTLGARPTLATVFASCRLHSLAIFTEGASSTADVASYLTWIAATCQFPWLAYDADAPLLLASDFSDSTHWDDSGHSKVGLAWRALEQAAVTRAGLSGATAVGMFGDSRLNGVGASSNAATARAVAQGGAYTYARTCVGPVADGFAQAWSNHFARSNYSTRTTTPTGSTPGHSQRSPDGSTTIDNWFGAGKAYNGTHRLGCVIGINELIQGEAVALLYDYVDELARLVEYCYASSSVASAFGFDLATEPLNGGETGGGPLTRAIRARNREYHALVAYLRGVLPGDSGFANLCDDASQT